ncbi:MAG TPA: hypothetical protein DIW81_25745 [Planctomycetaceae bacterium]|nr:hypothetical protein [Planctomycetaceae bacterium]
MVIISADGFSHTIVKSLMKRASRSNGLAIVKRFENRLHGELNWILLLIEQQSMPFNLHFRLSRMVIALPMFMKNSNAGI